MADDRFGFLDGRIPRSFTPPAGYEAVHQPGMSWARAGQRREDTSWITIEQWNHLIAQFRGLATIEGIDVADVAANSPMLLRDFLMRAIVAILEGEDLLGYDVLLRTGGTMTGALTLNADPSSALHAATKQYVDGKLAKNSNLADLPNLSDAQTNLGLSDFFKTLLTSGDQAALRTLIGLAYNDAAAQLAFRQNIGVDSGWATKAIGEEFPIAAHLTGISLPPSGTSGPVFILLTAGESDPGEFNHGKLTSESVSGSDPQVIATAVISFAGSPINGQTIDLINTEKRFLRPGVLSGTKQADAFQGHRHGPMAAGGSSGGAYGWSGSTNGASSLTAATGSHSGDPITDGANGTPRIANETRTKSVSRVFYMRIK